MTMAPLANNHISIDCVVFGFDGVNLRVLLVKRSGTDSAGDYNDMKLPGSLIYQVEALAPRIARATLVMCIGLNVPSRQRSRG